MTTAEVTVTLAYFTGGGPLEGQWLVLRGTPSEWRVHIPEPLRIALQVDPARPLPMKIGVYRRAGTAMWTVSAELAAKEGGQLDVLARVHAPPCRYEWAGVRG